MVSERNRYVDGGASFAWVFDSGQNCSRLWTSASDAYRPGDLYGSIRRRELGLNLI